MGKAILGRGALPWYRNGSALANSVAALWKLDEVSGVRAATIGSGVSLTDNNTVTSNTGLVYPLAAEFTAGNSESLSVASNSVVEVGGVDFALVLWFKTPASLSGAKVICNKFAISTDDSEYSLFLNGSTLTWRRFPDVAHDAVIASLSVSTWYFVIADYANSTRVASLQVNNGTINSNTTSAPNASQATAPMRFGGIAGAYLTGLIGPAALLKGYIPVTADRTFLYNGGLGRA